MDASDPAAALVHGGVSCSVPLPAEMVLHEEGSPR